MNIENARKAIAQLKSLKEGQFWMCSWIMHDVENDDGIWALMEQAKGVTPCNTVACGGGWISILNGGPTDELKGSPKAFAARFLGLESSEASYLFLGGWDAITNETGELGHITVADFTEELEQMIARAERGEPLFEDPHA